MQVSIIICTRNRAEHLRPTLDSLAAVTVPADWSVELILVDNGSTDDTRPVMHSFTHPALHIRILQVNTPGKSKALNRAVKAANGKVLLFTDDDVRVPPQWIGGMCRPILCGEADAVAGGVELASSVQADWMNPQHRSQLASTEQMSPQAPEHLIGANMAVGQHVFEIIPQFDPELGPGALGLGEDTLLGWQLQEAGFELVTAFDVAVEHHPDSPRLTPQGFRHAAAKTGRSEAYINYHWRNQTDWNVVSLLGGLVFFGLKLAWWRLRHWRTMRDEDQPYMKEFDLVRRLYRVRQHLVERGRDPKYAPYGLVKRRAPDGTEPTSQATPCEATSL